uniref:SAGA complex associated factor 29 n=1 Tax=Ovis aries TaxID=9940 RepID=A0AC11DH23_SHEEP
MALVSADSRIAELLTELHQLIKQTQEERSRSEHNLVNIQKTHERMQTENKISPYYRTKLRGLYTTAKADAEAECKYHAGNRRASEADKTPAVPTGALRLGGENVVVFVPTWPLPGAVVPVSSSS